jgi:hypothetical protein
MTVIKRDRKTTVEEFIKAIEQFVVLLRTQDEDDAIRALNGAAAQLGTCSPTSKDFRDAISLIIDAFEGDHELSAYTLTRKNIDTWTDADDLSLASSKVLSMAMRLR